MIAFIFKEREAVGVAIRRAEGKKVLIKSNDLKIKAKLSKLFNTGACGLSYHSTGTNCQSVIKDLSPGSDDHFWHVVHQIEASPSCGVEVIF